MKSTHRTYLIIGLLTVVGLTLIIPRLTQAAGLTIDCNVVTNTLEGKPTIENPCTIQDFFQQFVVVAQYAYSIIVVLGVLMLIYGGYQFLIAAGRQDKISEGKRIITGTIVGLLISVSAFVIINFTISAITDDPVKSANPFGFIAQVFVRPEDAKIKQPFSGTAGKRTASCRNWDKTCDGNSKPYQVFCTDENDAGGKIYNYQKQLKDLECGCNTLNGCFDAETVACVRRFQIANDIPLSGALDAGTVSKLTASHLGCKQPAQLDFVSNISSKLPETNNNYYSFDKKSTSTAEKGCCVVRATTGTGTQPFYCVSNATERACSGLGGNNTFDAVDGNCLTNPATTSDCGYCEHKDEKKCFDSGKYWCSNIFSPAQTFNAGLKCAPSAQCTDCFAGLRVVTPIYDPTP